MIELAPDSCKINHKFNHFIDLLLRLNETHVQRFTQEVREIVTSLKRNVTYHYEIYTNFIFKLYSL